MDVRKLKEGPLQRYKSSFLSSKWKDCWAVLYSDSTLCIFNERGESRPAETILIKNVAPYVCVGLLTDRMPVRRPALPTGASIERLVGVGMDPRGEKIHWLLFPSEKDLEDWFNAITSTLPTPPQQPPTVPGQNTPAPPSYTSAPSGPNSYVPPTRYPAAPPPVTGYHQGNPSGGYAPQPQAAAMGGYQGQGGGHQAPYPNQQYPGQQPAPGGYYQQPQQQPQQPQTVYIDRGGSSYANRGSSGLGSGLAGLGGGMLAGSLLGYGLGSFFHSPHHYGGGWGGGGFGGGYPGGGMGGGYPGFGGGYYSDNDTNITNNYYYNNGDGSTDHSTPAANQDSTPHAQTDYSGNDNYGNSLQQDYDGGGGSWDDVGGGDTFDSGGGGFDNGGDFGGGGDFDGGGGDW